MLLRDLKRWFSKSKGRRHLLAIILTVVLTIPFSAILYLIETRIGFGTIFMGAVLWVERWSQVLSVIGTLGRILVFLMRIDGETIGRVASPKYAM